jgi:hypothetical protein
MNEYRSYAVAPTNDSQSITPDELRVLADCFDPERMEIAIILRAAADAWEADLVGVLKTADDLAEEVGCLRRRLRNALAAWDIARDAVISDGECTRREGYDTNADVLFDAIGAALAGEKP